MTDTIPASTNFTARPYLLGENEDVVLELPTYGGNRTVREYNVLVRRTEHYDTGLNRIEYWLRRFDANSGIQTINEPIANCHDGIERVLAGTGFGDWRNVEDCDEATYTISEIVTKVMDHHRGCEEGKREFLADAFGWNPMSRHWGSEVSVIITQTYTISDGFEGDPDDIFESIAHSIRQENLEDRVEGLDQNSSRVEVNWL